MSARSLYYYDDTSNSTTDYNPCYLNSKILDSRETYPINKQFNFRLISKASKCVLGKLEWKQSDEFITSTEVSSRFASEGKGGNRKSFSKKDAEKILQKIHNRIGSSFSMHKFMQNAEKFGVYSEALRKPIVDIIPINNHDYLQKRKKELKIYGTVHGQSYNSRKLPSIGLQKGTGNQCYSRMKCN